jgi:prophage antirepressor-like protein
MSQVQILPFSFNGNQLNVIQQNEEAWFNAKDVCFLLEIQNVTQAVNRLDEDERSMFNIGRQGETNFINESGLYSLVLSSRKPEAKQFKRWITHEVLPAIRKHGGYLTPTKTEELLANPDLIIEMATNLKMERAKANQLLQMVDERNEIIDLQGQQLMKQAPAIEYYTKVLNAEDTVSTNIIAKELGMSAITLNKLLHEEYGIIYKQGDVWLPYARYQAMDLHRTKTYTYVASDGSIKTRISMVWTQKGRALIHELLKERK